MWPILGRPTDRYTRSVKERAGRCISSLSSACSLSASRPSSTGATTTRRKGYLRAIDLKYMYGLLQLQSLSDDGTHKQAKLGEPRNGCCDEGLSACGFCVNVCVCGVVIIVPKGSVCVSACWCGVSCVLVWGVLCVTP